MPSTIKQIGSVVLDSHLYIVEFDSPNTMQGESVLSAAGSHIAYSAPLTTPYRTAESRGESGWLSDQNIADLKALWLLDTTFSITYDDDSTETVRMAHEKQLSFIEISLGACIYTGFIPMAKV